jgi:5-methylcytosine-specific restriction endonuclease McrA
MVEAVEVHHIESRRDAPEKFFDPANLRGLCKSCHSRETARELNERRGVHGGAGSWR